MAIVLVSMVVGWLSMEGTAQTRQTSIEQAECGQVPGNLSMENGFRPIVEKAIAQAPTIRRQCATIAAAPHVRVVVRLQLGRLLGGARAQATITRYEHGALFAEIHIPVCVNQIEMLAHELEHVIEQIEGVNLAQRVEVRGSGVSRMADGAFETKRAEAAGRAAADEVSEYANPGAQPRARRLHRPG